MHAAVALPSLAREHTAEDATAPLRSAPRRPWPGYAPVAAPATGCAVRADSTEAEQLIREWQAGKKAAATHFYYLYKDRVYRWARIKTRDPHLAEDLCQEVWRRIHRSLQTYRLGTSPSAWVYRILINTHRSLWRRGQRFVASLLSGLQGEQASPLLPEPSSALGGTPETLCNRKQELEQILSAMHAIPECYRQVVFLRYVEGLPIEEVANILGITDGTVKSRLNRGIEKLRERIGLCVQSRPGVVR
jgi:RNA polymerase sigma-70 factor (ECF subfamily)